MQRCKDGRRFWCGTVLTNAQAISILGESARTNATQLQVAISILAGIEWMLENPNKGVITAEAIPHKYILSRCIPYWGNFYCREITITPPIQNYSGTYSITEHKVVDPLQ